MKFNKKYQTLFLDPHSEVVNRDDKLNIILSPSLYWVKKISLPVKYSRDVSKLLPSIFEDVLPEGNYSYFVYKYSKTKGENSDFFVFAYEDKKILDVISEKNISMLNVANVYFAQSELQDIKNVVKINDTESVCVKDDIVILVPCSWADENSDLDLSSHQLTKHKVSLQQFGHIVDSKSLYKIGAIMVMMILLIVGEYFITTQKSEDIAELKEQLFSKYNLQTTMIQNKSTLKKYQTIHKEQTNLRAYASHILSINLKPQEKLTHFNLKNRSITAQFSGIDKSNFTHITKSLDSKNIKFKTNYKNETLYVEIAL